MAVIDREWIEARIEATKAAIVAHEEALVALASGAQSYVLDTGQTRQQVTKANIGSLRLALEALENRLSYYEIKLCGGGSIIGRPGF